MPPPKWKLHCFFRVPTSALEFNGKDLRMLRIQPKMGVALGMSKKGDGLHHERVPFVKKAEYFWQLDLLHAEVQCSAMDWDEKILKIYMDPYPKEAIHQVRKNDGKHPHVFLFGPLNFFCSLLYCFFPEEAMVGCSSPSQSHPTNVSPHPSFWGLRSKAAHHWTWYCSKDCKWGGGASAPRVCWWTKMYEDGRTKASFDNKPTKTFRRSDLTKSKPSRKLTYPTWEKGKSSSNMDCFRGDMLIPWRVIIFQTDWNQQTDFAFQETNFHLLLRTGMGAPVSWQPRKYPFESFDVCPTGKWRIPMFNPFCHQGRLLISCVSPRVFRNEYSEKLPSKLAVSLPVVPKIRGLCRSSSKDVYIYIYVSVRETSFKTKQKSQAFYQEQVLYPSHATDHDS